MTNLFSPVVPADAFAITAKGATYVHVARGERASVSAAGHLDFPAGSSVPGTLGAPVFSATAFTTLAAAARKLVAGRISRAGVAFPDSWARTITLDFDLLPANRRERTEMVAWKVKKLLPGRPDGVEISFHEIPPARASLAPPENPDAKDSEESKGSALPPAPVQEKRSPVRLLVCATPRETLHSIEAAFSHVGIRVGRLLPATLALFDGFDRRLARAARGDYLLLHRAEGTISLLIARDGLPLFYRQKSSAQEDTDISQELRLSLVYYNENFGEGKTPPLFVCDEENGEGTLLVSSPLSARRFSPELLETDETLGVQAASRPDLWTAAAVVLENR